MTASTSLRCCLTEDIIVDSDGKLPLLACFYAKAFLAGGREKVGGKPDYDTDTQCGCKLRARADSGKHTGSVVDDAGR